MALLLVAQTLLVALTVNYESSRAQDDVEAVSAAAGADLRHDLMGMMQNLQAVGWDDAQQTDGRAAAMALLRTRRDLKRIEWRRGDLTVSDAVDTPFLPHLFSQMPRQNLAADAEVACQAARRTAAPTFSRSYFVPLPGGQGVEVLDLCVPLLRSGREARFLVGSFALSQVLEASLPPEAARRHEFSFVEGDGTRLARAGAPRGAGIFVAQRAVDLPGATLQLRTDSAAGRPASSPTSPPRW